METLAEQPTQELQRKSYEPLASVNALRFDIDNFGDIQPETRRRVGEEELSYLVEGIDKASRTSFILRRQGEDIVYFNQGKWENYKTLLYTGLNVAKEEASEDPRRAFLVDRATEDLVNGNIMCGLQPGEQYVWWSPYEHEIEDRYGDEFMRQCGRQPDRKMGFLYRAYCNQDGDILLESQTLDQSDIDGFEAISRAAENNPGEDMEGMVKAYDDALREKHGRSYFAGRDTTKSEENAWEEIHKHRDLIEYHLNTLEQIAASGLDEVSLEKATKRHTYGVWAAFKKRIEDETSPHISSDFSYVSHQYDHHLHSLLEQETKTAFNDFASQGKVMVGCGGGFRMVANENDVLQSSGADVHSSIFGGDKHGSLTFTCPRGHRNKRKYGKLLKACQHEGCKAKVACK